MNRGTVGRLAAEIDRLVIGSHEGAAAADKPAVLSELNAHLGLLNTLAVVLMNGPVSRDSVARVMPFLPAGLTTALIDDNVANGVLDDDDATLRLAERGRLAAAAVVELQEKVAADDWANEPEALATADGTLASIVAYGLTIEAPRVAATFSLFAPTINRPTVAGRVLRSITVVRYWRADAHGAALDAVDLRPRDAHALNRLWDASRGVSRVGQGFAEPGSKGVATLEAIGWAAGGVITPAGIEVREAIEADTDRRTSPLYARLDGAALATLVDALAALPT